MRKSTLTKLLCLALVCLMILPMIVSCGSKVTISFDPGEGTLAEEEMIRKVKKGDPIGQMPTPKRAGYKFAGWYAEDDTDFEDKYRASDLATFDMTLVANWEINADNPPITVEFDANGGELADGQDVIVIESGTAIGELPVPTLEGYEFKGWYFESDKTFQNQIRKTTKIEGKDDVVLVARWTVIVYCTGGGDHDWAMWQEYTQADCDTPQQDVRMCKICGHSEYKDGAAALGHDWSKWSSAFLSRTRTCKVCQEEDIEEFKNVTTKGLGEGNYPVIEGSGWGKDKAAALVNGILETDGSKGFAGDSKSAVKVTLTLVNPQEADMLYVYGLGSASYTVTVYDETGTKVQLETNLGTFGSIFEFELGCTVSKVEIYMATPSYGTDYWLEIALGKME